MKKKDKEIEIDMAEIDIIVCLKKKETKAKRISKKLS